MKRLTAAIASGLVVLVLVVIAGCSGGGSTATPTTRTSTVTRGNLTLDISAAGNLAFSHTEDLAFTTFYQQATVSDVSVAVGDTVTQGQELATIDPSEWQTNLDSLENAVTNADRNVATKQQAVQSANQTLITRQQAVTAATNALAADQAQIASRQLAVTQAQLDVTTANNTINNLTDIKDILDQIDQANQTIATATMILNSTSLYGVTLDVTNRQYFLNLITGSQSFITQLNAQLKSLLNGTTAMSTSQAQLQLQQDQLNLQQKQLALANAQAAVIQAQQGLADDQTAIDFAKQAVTTAQQNITFAEQDLASAQDNYNTARQNLADAQAESPVVTAPFAGIITKVNVAGGDKVQNGTVAVSIADPSRFEASILVSELDIPQVSIGDTATVSADAVPNAAYTATVTQISPTATISSGVVNYPVTVELQALTPITSNSTSRGGAGFSASGNLSERLQQAVDSGQMTEEQAKAIEQRIASGNFTRPTATSSTGSRDGGFGGFPGGGVFGNNNNSSTGGTQSQGQLATTVVTSYQLRQGMTVTVDISIAERTNVLLVPNAAVTTSSGKSYVTLIGDNGQTSQQEVQTGLNDWENTEITSGLTEGQKVVVPLSTAPTSTSNNNFRGGGFGILRGG